MTRPGTYFGKRLTLAIGASLLVLCLSTNLFAHCGSALCAPILTAPPSASSFAPTGTESIPFVPDSYTIAVFPDTQNMTNIAANNDEFYAMTQWLVENKATRNIELMLHEGDVTNANGSNTVAWDVAKMAIVTLDGEIPYVLGQGNHDMNSSTRNTLMNNYFGVSDNSLNGPTGINTTLYQPGQIQNSYSTFSAPGGRDFLIINIEFGPRQAVVDWAKGVATDPQYTDHTAILLTHAYMEEGPADASGEPTAVRGNWDVYGSSRPHNPNSYGIGDDALDGQELWDSMVRKSDSNFKLVFNGHHLDGNDSNAAANGPGTTSLQVDRADDGELVYQMVANWQQQANGGNGYMRLLEFLPDGQTIQVKTYSPSLDLWLTDPRNQFTIDLDATEAEVGLPTNPIIGITATGAVTGGDDFRGAMTLESVTTVEGSFNNLQFPSSVTLTGSGLEEFVGQDLGAITNEDTLTDANLNTGIQGATQIVAMFDGILADTNGKDVSNLFLFGTSSNLLTDDVLFVEALDENGNPTGVPMILTDLWGDTQFDAESQFPAPGTSPDFEENMIGLGIDIAAFGIPQLSGLRITLDESITISGIAATADILGDLNQDGTVNELDWPIFVANSLVDLSIHTPFEAFLRGDMDGDMDNDLQDFLQFKKTYDMANGPGAFNAMIEGVPEPSSCLLVGMGVLALLHVRRRPTAGVAIAAATLVALLAVPSTSHAVPVNFTGFTLENYPLTNNQTTGAAAFPAMGPWNLTTTTASQATSNGSVSVLYGNQSILDERIIGTINPGGDDDILGLVLGFNPGDTSNTSADFLLLDWKRSNQSFDFGDNTGGPFHDLTGETLRGAGLRLSRVTGTPTADELWSTQTLAANPSGGVTQLGTAATLRSTGYPTNTDIQFDILYTSSRVVVTIDGVVEFDVSGSFPEGRLGLYSGWMGNANLPVYSNFQIGDPDETLKAIVNRTTGQIKLFNNSDDPINFDSYELRSEDDSLDPTGWNSLDDQNLDPVGTGFGQTWDESTGSNPSALMELFLLGSTNLSPGTSVNLGLAYDTTTDAQDVSLNFRNLPIESASIGIVEYITSPIGDINGDGIVSQSDVNAFVQALTDRAAFEINYPGVNADDLGDFNSSGSLDLGDVSGFIAAVNSPAANSSSNSVPEPSGVFLLTLGILAFTAKRNGRTETVQAA